MKLLKFSVFAHFMFCPFRFMWRYPAAKAVVSAALINDYVKCAIVLQFKDRI